MEGERYLSGRIQSLGAGLREYIASRRALPLAGGSPTMTKFETKQGLANILMTVASTTILSGTSTSSQRF
jgi:hypothetical protein